MSIVILKKPMGNLVLIGGKRQLYYFPNTKPNVIKVNVLDEIFAEYEDDPNAIVPYRSTIMTTNEYEHFIEVK